MMDSSGEQGLETRLVNYYIAIKCAALNKNHGYKTFFPLHQPGSTMIHRSHKGMTHISELNRLYLN